MRLKMKLATTAAMALGLMASVAAAEDVEVLHWWTAGGEAAALTDEYVGKLRAEIARIEGGAA